MNINPSKPNLKYSKRLAAGTITSVFAMASASGAVVTTNIDQFFTVGQGFNSFTPTTGSFVTTYDTSYMAGIRNCGLNLLLFGSNFEWALGALSAGTTVDNSLTYGGTQFLAYPADGETVFAGFRVLNQGAGNDQTHYGYAMVTGGSSLSFTFDSFSYETSPTAGIVTTIPEVSTLTFCMLAAGTFFWRRRRSA